MPMPTTRRERYRFYRARARRRARRLASLGSAEEFGTGVTAKRLTTRRLDHAGDRVQLPRVYPLRPVWMDNASGGDDFWAVKPARGVWGVPGMPEPALPLGWAPTTNRKGPWQFYAFRRVKHRAKLRAYARLPLPFPKEVLPEGAFFRRHFYPSGAVTFWWSTFIEPPID